MAESAFFQPQGACVQVDRMFREYFGNPESPQADEVRRVLNDLLLRHAELESKVGHLKTIVQQLEAYRDRYVDLYELAPVGYSTVDEEGYVQEINLAGSQLLGRDRDEVIGYPFESYLDSQDRANFRIQVRRCCAGKQAITFEAAIARDGTPISVQIRGVPVESLKNDETFCKLAITDISERKAAEIALQKARDELEEQVRERTAEIVTANEALRQSERRFRNYFEQGLVGMAATAPDKRWLGVNDRVCDMLGYSKEELYGKTWAELTHPEDLAIDVGQFEHLLKGDIQNYTLDKRFIRKDGAVVYTTIHIRAFRKEDGSLDHIVALLEDISARREAEEALRREHRMLKHLLQSSDRERQTIAYEIHDSLAQQLVGAIMQFQTFDALKEAKPTLAVKAYETGLAMLQQGHCEARRLISGVRPPILDEAGVVEAISHLVCELQHEDGPRIDYHSHVEFDRLVPILENAIYRIAQEGLANACRHSKSQKVRVGLSQRGERVRIEIQDWGVGFDVKKLKKGSYGLEGIQQRAKLLGGKCSIRSTPGKGTRIIVELPVMEREEE